MMTCLDQVRFELIEFIMACHNHISFNTELCVTHEQERSSAI